MGKAFCCLIVEQHHHCQLKHENAIKKYCSFNILKLVCKNFSTCVHST